MMNEKIDISNWNPIGWSTDLHRIAVEAITDNLVTLDELMARYNFLLLDAHEKQIQNTTDSSNGAENLC